MSQSGILNIAGGGGAGSPITSLTGDTGGAVPPTANNINTVGSGSITVAGNAGTSTLTTQLTGLTNHAVLVGAGTTTITKVGPVASTGAVLMSNGVGSDPGFSTATYPATTTANQLLYSSATNTVAGLTGGNSLLAATDSSGVLAMRALSINTQVFTSNGTYTPSAGMLYCIIECLGGGGAGGGAATGGGVEQSAGSGGGAGSYARKFASATTIGASKAVTVGAGGTPGTAGNNPGGNGGNSSVTTICVANGGTGGTGSAGVTYNLVAGGLGGTGGTGDFVTHGASGSSGFSFYLTGVAQSTFSGAGGSSIFGSGGRSVGGYSANAGEAGLTYGSGGSGATSINGGGDQQGGAGTAGIVIITEYIIA